MHPRKITEMMDGVFNVLIRTIVASVISGLDSLGAGERRVGSSKDGNGCQKWKYTV